MCVCVQTVSLSHLGCVKNLNYSRCWFRFGFWRLGFGLLHSTVSDTDLSQSVNCWMLWPSTV